VTGNYHRRPNTSCTQCATPIYRRPVEMRRSGGKAFCSSACYGRANRKEAPCIVCSTPILARANKKTCSRSCANTNRAGITYKRGRPRDKVSSQRAVKLQVIEMRGAQCERCAFALQEILHIHHIDRNPQNNAHNNLELLCPNCHAKEHYFKNE
jgi:5-methylcytosine-specific restriction endonuclease McrA